MNDDITLRAFFGDGTHTFALTDEMLVELERLTSHGIGAIYAQVIGQTYSAATLREIIRLGLIGGGMAPKDAAQLCDTYATNRPVAEVYPVAFEVLETRWTGAEVAA